jgi:DNA polymerase-3 subunit epsilon
MTTEHAGPAGPPPDHRLPGLEFVIVDVETTGWQPDKAMITEIGAVRIGPDGHRAEFASLVNPGQPIPADIVELTGITDEMVRQAPPAAEVLPAFLAFAHGGVLTAHNAPFDIGFLAAACQRSGLSWPEFTVLDTAALARLLLPDSEVPDRKLATLATHFSTRTRPAHRALADAQATADVLEGLLIRLAEAGVLTVNCRPMGGRRRGDTLTPTAGRLRRLWSRLTGARQQRKKPGPRGRPGRQG